MIVFIPEKALANFGLVHEGDELTIGRGLWGWLGRVTVSRAKYIVAVVILLSAIAIYGITKININDNPIKWFEQKHPIRVADVILNEHFGGTYMAYLALSAAEPVSVESIHKLFLKKLAELDAANLAEVASVKDDLVEIAERASEQSPDSNSYFG